MTSAKPRSEAIMENARATNSTILLDDEQLQRGRSRSPLGRVRTPGTLFHRLCERSRPHHWHTTFTRVHGDSTEEDVDWDAVHDRWVESLNRYISPDRQGNPRTEPRVHLQNIGASRRRYADEEWIPEGHIDSQRHDRVRSLTPIHRPRVSRNLHETPSWHRTPTRRIE